MTPAELLALAEAATPGPGDTPPFSWTGARAGDKMAANARLISLAPDLARLCAGIGEDLEEIAKERFGVMPDGSTPSSFASAALAKLSELEPR